MLPGRAVRPRFFGCWEEEILTRLTPSKYRASTWLPARFPHFRQSYYILLSFVLQILESFPDYFFDLATKDSSHGRIPPPFF